MLMHSVISLETLVKDDAGDTIPIIFAQEIYVEGHSCGINLRDTQLAVLSDPGICPDMHTLDSSTVAPKSTDNRQHPSSV